MKNKIDRMKTPAMHLSKRTVALILSVIMLVSSIATGSMLNTFAAYIKDNAAKTDAIADAASEGSAIAESAIPSEDADAPAQADDADEKPDLSGFEENEIVRGMKDDLASTGAKADLAATGYDKWYVKGDWDNWAKPDDSIGHNITSGPFEKDLAANTTYEFVFVGNNDQFSSNTTISGTTDYNFSRNNTDTIKLKTTIAGKYKFYYKGMDGGQTSMTVRIEFPVDDTPTTWTVVGDNASLFGTAWAPTATANDMTKSGNTWTWTKNNVQLSAGTIEYKIAKNHAWDTTVPADATNLKQTVSTAGLYNVTVTYSGSGNPTMTLTSVKKSTLTVASVNNAVVTATYNGTTKNEGGTISDIPQGATVNVSVTPDSGYKCTGITCNPTATTSGSMYSFTLTMPASNTTVTADITTVKLKKVYFSNGVTGYGQVYAYSYKKSGSTVTDEYLGKYPGTTMTKMENSNIWYIEVPDDTTYIEFVSGEGYNTGELTIPWDKTNPKYYPGMDREHPSVGGDWQEYYPRTNEYTVTDGTTMSASNLFTGITATMYDYYVDDEVTGNWLTGISSHATNYDNTGHTYHDPYYEYFNTSLMKYANTTDMPEYGVTYPLYFGNLNYKNNATEEAKYYNWNGIANNSNYLNNSSNAVTGLSGKTLAGSTIHHYDSSAANENGAPMAMFDEDFLSGENAKNKTLATILRTSTFPVRQETVNSIYLNPNSIWNKDGAWFAVVFRPNSNNTTGEIWVKMTYNTSLGLYTAQIPSQVTSSYKVIFARMKSSDTSTLAWSNKWNDTGEKSMPTGSNVTAKITSIGSGTDGTGAGMNWVAKSGSNTHTYYEYDSTGGKDNAFITNIDTDKKTANIDYYAGSSYAVKSQNDKEGFFPFDYNNIVSTTYNPNRVYLKPNSDWVSDGAKFAARFKADGKSDVIYFLSNDTTLNLYFIDIPDGYNTGTVDFIRAASNATTSGLMNWTGKWNDTGFVDLPTDNKVVREITGWDNSSKWISNDNITVPKSNGYADATNRKAHDQGFGMKLTIPFNLNANGLNKDGTPQTFDFSGDDDLWVFVDGKLVLDLGGAHGATTGSINFNTKTVTANNAQSLGSGSRNGSFADGFNTNENYVHTMTIYYMERGMFDSNLKFGFSFHAIPNQFWIDKKIRTKDIINAGFYTDNNQTGNASNKDATMSTSEGRFISKFEASYQNESFTVEHKYGSTAADATTPASSMKYTIDNDTNTYTTPSEGTYPIKHDLGNAFIGQFTKGQYFNLKETFGNNKYVYTPVFSVWDQANNDKAITASGDNTSGYTFHFNPTTDVPTAIENTNIKARFENFMVAHTLTLKKEITNATDTTTLFTIQVMFDFENDGKYIAYPLYCDLDGERTQLSKTGTIDIKAGQILEIEEIPQNAKIQVKEVFEDTVSGYRYDGVTVKKGSTTVTPTTVTKGAQFVMGDDDMTMTFSNKKPDNHYSIKYIYPSYDNLYGNQFYVVKGVFTENEMQTYLTLNNGKLAFASDTLKKTFINKKAPLEDNFMQTLSFSDSTINEQGGGWDADENYSCEVAAVGSNTTITASFNLPYAVDESLVPQDNGSGKVQRITAATKGMKNNIDCFDWYVTSGKTNSAATGDDPEFVKAPLIIYEGSTPYYFQYWSVKKASSYGMKAAEYTRCYDYEFNLSLFMDTVIEPVYGTTWAQTDNPPTAYDMYGRFDPEKQIAADSTNGISIAFLENSRNQYNEKGGGSRDKGDAADVIYSDFLLSFNNFAGKEQLNTRTEGTTKAGLVIEAVDYMEKDSSGKYDPSFDYLGKYKTDRKSEIQTWVEGGASKDNRPNGLAVSQFDVKSLDNKNRIQYYYALNNRKLDTESGQLLNTLQNRYKVFRAYAYIGNVKSGGGLQDVVVSEPVYFTIYDMASHGLTDNASN